MSDRYIVVRTSGEEVSVVDTKPCERGDAAVVLLTRQSCNSLDFVPDELDGIAAYVAELLNDYPHDEKTMAFGRMNDRRDREALQAEVEREITTALNASPEDN